MGTILLSVIAYISTNTDDLLLNMFFFAQTTSLRETRSIICGKFLGVGMLTAGSILGAWGLQTFSSRWLSLLGIVPVALGLRDIIRNIRNAEDEPAPSVAGTFWLRMAMITIASGADNIGVYIPLFAGFTPWQMILSAAVFMVMTEWWCALSRRLADLPGVRNNLIRYQATVIPIVYILIGLYILI